MAKSLREQMLQDDVRETLERRAISKIQEDYTNRTYDLHHPDWRQDLEEFVDKARPVETYVATVHPDHWRTRHWEHALKNAMKNRS